MSENHDDMLFSMLKDCKTLPVFLDEVFGFLYRRSDFYVVTTDPNSPVGLPPGLGEKVVKDTFYKWKNFKTTPENSLPQLPKPVNGTSRENSNFSSSDSYNGATFDNYSWSQNLLEVDVTIKLPVDTNAKNLVVQIQPDRLLVKTGDLVVLQGDFCEKCKHHDALWSIQHNKLEIHLDKQLEKWWDCCLTSEDRLDVNKLDCSRPFEELPEEAQARIQELQWNQERKRLGLPTSDEIVLRSALKESWSAEGSPFSGPYDPESVKLN